MATLTAWDGTAFPIDPNDPQAAYGALAAYVTQNPPPAPPPAPPAPTPPPPMVSKYGFMLLFRDDERGRYRVVARQAAALTGSPTTQQEQLLDSFSDFSELFDRLADPPGVNLADPQLAASMQLFTALGIIASAEASWRVPQILAGQAPTTAAPTGG